MAAKPPGNPSNTSSFQSFEAAMANLSTSGSSGKTCSPPPLLWHYAVIPVAQKALSLTKPLAETGNLQAQFEAAAPFLKSPPNPAEDALPPIPKRPPPLPTVKWTLAHKISVPNFSGTQPHPFLNQRNGFVSRHFTWNTALKPKTQRTCSHIDLSEERAKILLPHPIIIRKEWLDELIVDWAKNSHCTKGPLANALILAKLMNEEASEREFCYFIKKISSSFYQGEREGLDEEAEGLYRDLKAKNFRGTFDPFYELVVQPTLSYLSGGMKKQLSLYREEASLENPDLLFTLASFCMQGWETGTRDEVEALRLYNLAATKEHPGSFFTLGKILQEKAGEDPTTTEAALYYKQAADRGHKEAQLEYAHFLQRMSFSYMTVDFSRHPSFLPMLSYSYGLWHFDKDIFSDQYETFSFYKKVAEYGNHFAQCILAECYELGIGTLLDSDKAIEWYTKSAAFGNQKAQEALLRIRSQRAQSIPSAEKPPSAPPRMKEEREQRLIALNTEWKNNIAGMFGIDLLGNIEKNGDILITLFCKEAVSEQEFADFCTNTGYFDPNTRWRLTLLHKKCTMLAKSGLLHPLYALGRCYEAGFGVPENEGQGYKLFFKAATQGNAEAQYIVGEALSAGFGTACAPEEGITWYKKAGAQKHSDALFAIGRCYQRGMGVEKNLFEAADLYKLSADLGNSRALVALGRCYENGYGVPIDYRKAVHLYTESANQMHPEGIFELGRCYAYEVGVAENLGLATEMFRRAIRGGSWEAKEVYGMYLGIKATLYEVFYKKPIEEALCYFTLAAEAGHPEAQVELGTLYLGLSIKQDVEKAFSLFQKAAESRDPQTLQSLIKLCEKDSRWRIKDPQEEEIFKKLAAFMRDLDAKEALS